VISFEGGAEYREGRRSLSRGANRKKKGESKKLIKLSEDEERGSRKKGVGDGESCRHVYLMLPEGEGKRQQVRRPPLHARVGELRPQERGLCG